jgi:hypothetical protein
MSRQIIAKAEAQKTRLQVLRPELFLLRTIADYDLSAAPAHPQKRSDILLNGDPPDIDCDRTR